MQLLGAFTKLRKVNICFVKSVRLSFRMEQLRSHYMDFREIWYFENVSKICPENSSLIKIEQE